MHLIGNQASKSSGAGLAVVTEPHCHPWHTRTPAPRLSAPQDHERTLLHVWAWGILYPPRATQADGTHTAAASFCQVWCHVLLWCCFGRHYPAHRKSPRPVLSVRPSGHSQKAKWNGLKATTLPERPAHTDTHLRGLQTLERSLSSKVWRLESSCPRWFPLGLFKTKCTS